MSESGNGSVTSEVRSRSPRLRIVVFGGIGSGKSTVTAMLEARGAVVIEADRIGHLVLAPGHPVARMVGERWPETVVDGEIDRARLAAVVFNDPYALSELESYTHPAIGAEIVDRADNAGDVPVVVEVPLVAPWFGPEWWWVLVTADAGTRLERTVERGADRGDAARRLAAQPAPDDYEAAADFVIDNEGDLDDLTRRVAEVWSTLEAT